MTKTITYTNRETNMTIKLSLEKKRIFIYGKNGSGKTTLSNSDSLDSKYVFNEVFIRKNVFVINENGATTDSNVKNNFSGLLLGEDVIKIRNAQNHLTEIRKTIDKKFNEIKENIKNTLNANYIDSNYSVLNDSIIDDSITLQDCYDFEEKIDEYRNQILDDNYHALNEEDMKTYLAQIRNNKSLKNLVEKINCTDFLKEYLLLSDNKENLSKLNSEIDELNSNKKELLEIEEIIKRKNINISDWKVIEKCIDIQNKSKLNECLLCGNTDYIRGIEEWNVIKNDECNKIKKSILERIKKESNYINNSILPDKSVYCELAPNTLAAIETFQKLLIDLTAEIEKNEINSRIGDRKKEIENLVIDLDELIKNVVYNLLKSYISPYILCSSLVKLISEEITRLKNKIRKTMEKDADEYSKNINEILCKLGLDNKNVELTVDGRGNDIKYSLKIKENTLAELSNGQKHKLALAVFLNSIKNKDLSNAVLVFDDPIVSLDEISYHRFKDYLIKEILSNYSDIENSPYLIILTHNFGYFNVQISNIIENDDLRKDAMILRIDSDGLHSMNPDSFKLDDIALYKNGITKTNCINSIIDLAMISNKIIRELIDIKLRFSGNVINDNPSKEIDLLEIDDEKKRQIKAFERKTVVFRKRKSNEIGSAIDCIVFVKETSQILGFGDFIKNEDIERLSRIENVEDKMSDENIIIHEIANLFREYDEKNNYIKYLNHPRISFTKNMFSSALDLHE